MCVCERVIDDQRTLTSTKGEKDGTWHRNSRSSHHPLSLGTVAAQVRFLGQLRNDGGLDVGEAEFRELEVGSDGVVVDAEHGEDQSDEDAGALCRWEVGQRLCCLGVAEVECGMMGWAEVLGWVRMRRRKGGTGRRGPFQRRG